MQRPTPADSSPRRCARLLIRSRANELLLFRHADEWQPPFWATPGGELQSGETYLDAARRELLEETGKSLPIGPVVRERSAVFAVAKSQPCLWHERYFLVESRSRFRPTNDGWTEEEQETIQALKWWSPEAMGRSPETFLPEWLKAAALELGRRHTPRR